MIDLQRRQRTVERKLYVGGKWCVLHGCSYSMVEGTRSLVATVGLY
jgi:hypothetical protein